MKKIALATVVTAAVLSIMPAASAHPYSKNENVRAHLSPVVHCRAKATLRNLYLINDSNVPRTYRVFSNDSREKTWDHFYKVQPHDVTRVTFYLIIGELQWATVTYNHEVIVHRSMRGICY